MKYLLLIPLLFASCRPSLQRCNDLYGHCGRIDTLTTTTVFRDTTVVVEADTSVFFVPVMQRDTVTAERIIERIRRASVKAGIETRYYWLNDSTLKVESICPAETVTVKGKDRIEYRTQVKTELVPTETMPKWAWIVMGMLGLIVFILILVRR